MTQRQTEEQLQDEWKQKVSSYHGGNYKVRDIEIIVMPNATDSILRVKTAGVPRSYYTSSGEITRERE